MCQVLRDELKKADGSKTALSSAKRATRQLRADAKMRVLGLERVAGLLNKVSRYFEGVHLCARSALPRPCGFSNKGGTNEIEGGTLKCFLTQGPQVRNTDACEFICQEPKEARRIVAAVKSIRKAWKDLERKGWAGHEHGTFVQVDV